MHEPTPRYAICLAAGVPLALYVLTASGHGYWLDSGEFTASSVWLDIAHPPGHPLASLWGKLFTLLPLGPLSYRVAAGQALAAALALGLALAALDRTLIGVGVRARGPRTALTLGAACLLAFAYGFWFQAVRAEVYALEALLVCVALERVSALALADSPRDVRPFLVACAALGLGLANHHFIAVLALPALAHPLLMLTRAHGPRVLGLGLLAGAPGLLTYAYLPLRALTEPPMDLGHPVAPRELAWVMSARIYARRVGTAAPSPLGERMLDLLVLLDENFGITCLLLALLGAYALLRVSRTRGLAALWLSTAIVSLCGRAFLNEVRANPDVLGYMMPGFVALVALAVAGVGALASTLRPLRSPRLAAPLAILLALGVALTQLARQHPRASLADFRATDAFADLTRRTLPSGALLVLTTPEAVFRYWEGEATEQLRADVTMVPLPFVGYGKMHETLLRRAPELAPLLSSYLATGELARAPLAALARARPLLLELDVRTSLPIYDDVVPEGLLFRMLPREVPRASLVEAAHARRALVARLVERIGRDVAEPETRKQLLFLGYVEALYLTARGERELALEATRRALAHAPRTRELRLLEAALADPDPPSFAALLVALGHRSAR